MGHQTIEFDVRGGVGYLTLNRPKANSLNLEMAEDLEEVAHRCDTEPAIRALLLTGAGSMFCAGGDLKAFSAAAEGTPAYLEKVASTLHRALAIFARMDAPVVAAVNGVAAGAGMSLACQADIALAAESAKFTMAYTAAGLTPDGSSTFVLPRTIGRRRTTELMLTNRVLSAAEAADWGLVNRVVPDADLMAEAGEVARALADGPTRAFGGVKRLLVASASNDLEAQLDLETRSIVEMSRSHDGVEGVAAFLEKRPPKFTGA